MRVLIVEDHRELADTVATGLRQDGMAVDLAYDGAEALDLALVHDYDVVVLDRDLPRLHGDEVCRVLVGRGGRCRVLMLTAATTIEDRVDGLSLGADDYLPKPFAFAELIARVRALARRAQPAVPPVLSRGDLTLDCAQRVARRDGRPVELSRNVQAGQVLVLGPRGGEVSPVELQERAWDQAADPFTNTVKVTVSRLRRKLGDPPVIETVPHAGYRI
ncbi:response regulator transcription factor [Streptomyces lasiicapitis]|uniref:response regulator transcription factor n=1 Tax=Streptomyces lasiicapitis TaxID=1923961 RepID=UPI0036CADE25